MKRAALFLIGLFLTTAAAILILIQTDWFKDRVRRKIVSVVEDATGGRAEIGAFQYDWRTLTASVAPFVLHGNEPANRPPLLRAARIELGLRIVSIVERNIDLRFLQVLEPQVVITVAPDGSTNIPTPKIRRSSKSLVQDLLDLKIGRLEISNGFAEYNSQRIPLDIHAEGMEARFRYEAAGPRYAGQLTSRAVRLPDVTFALDSRFTIDRSRAQIADATMSFGGSRVRASGFVEDFSSLRGSLKIQADLQYRGSESFSGTATFRTLPAFDWEVQGRASGRLRDQLRVVTSLRARPNRLELPDLNASALDTAFKGRAAIDNWKKLTLTGDLRASSLHSLKSAACGRGSEGVTEPPPQGAGFLCDISNLDASISGPIQLDALIQNRALRDITAQARLNLEPAGNGPLVQGFVDAVWRQTPNLLSLSDSDIRVGASRIQASGTLGQMLNVRASTRDLREIPLPKDLPLTLKGGGLQFEGTISGPIENPQISGQIEATRFAFDGNDIEHLNSRFDLSRSGVNAHTLTLAERSLHVQGSLQAGLVNWKIQDSSPISGSLQLRGVDIQKLLEERGSKAPITGILAATADFKGTYANPQGSAGIDAENVVAYQEPFTRIRAAVVLAGNRLQVIDGRLTSKAGQLQVTGTFEHQPGDWTTGQLKFDVSGRELDASQVHYVQTARKGLAGIVDVDASGIATLTKNEPRVQSVSGKATIKNGGYDGRIFGNAILTADTREGLLHLEADANLLDTPIRGSGEWKLEGDDPGHGQIIIPRVTMAALHRAIPDPVRRDLPFEGFLESKIDLEGPLRKPDQMRAAVTVNALQINSNPAALPRAGAQARDLVLRNSQPIVLEATTKGIDIRNAKMTGTDTTLEARGRFSFDSKTPWDMHLNGTVNLAVLQIFNPNLLGSGSSIVDASIRGPLGEPNVEGRLEVKNASLYVTDLPNGLDQANGLIVFDRNRATVDSLTAVTGGGRITIQKGSFVGFRGPALLYRVQASADRVRYRSPDGVSLTVNALLSLIGTSQNSVLSGTVTVMRAGFNPTTDVGSLLATTAKPTPAPSAPNDYLRGIQLDVRVESAQSLEIQTSLTRNIEAEANLRVRGTPERPVVLGNVMVTEGQIEFFGNKYTINRAEVNFYNQVKIEPIIDMDLETVVRGITVDITFAGPLNKLNFSYRSDPPLQTNDIVALLAVGRTPVNATSLTTTTSTSTNTNYLSTGTNALLSQAISAPVSGRLQRFFGVSHIKIDPQLTDITSLPQARLTLEQQISKDITLTYITNLTRTQEQIVRIEWDLNRQWSVIALRDENGAFGLDIQYRKRFR